MTVVFSIFYAPLYAAPAKNPYSLLYDSREVKHAEVEKTHPEAGATLLPAPQHGPVKTAPQQPLYH
jgi:hypothetical protein